MESNANEVAANAARAITAAMDWSTTPDNRKAAVAYLETIKTGDVRVLANISFLLVKKDWSSEIRLQAFKMLQHLVRLRWEELNPEERRYFANTAVDLMSEIAAPCEEWALKSQTAALVAEIVRREGLSLWQVLFQSLASLSSKGPAQAELVAMTLRWLPEDITVHNEDLEGDRRRQLLRGLTQSLPEIFQLLYSLLERHFGAALSEAARQLDIAKQHAATVTATLNAMNAYAEWAPLPDLVTYGVIYGCGSLLSSPDFRLHACEFFKLVTARKRPADCAASEFNSSMSTIFQTVLNVSGELLRRSNSGAVDESDCEFAEYLCESMVSLGSLHLPSIAHDDTILSVFLQQMLHYFQHYKFVLHYQALQFWLVLMRDLESKAKVVAQSAGESATNFSSGSGQTDNEKRKILNFLNDDICSIILDISLQRMLKKEKLLPGSSLSLGALELWSNDIEGKGDFAQYRNKLVDLIRHVSFMKPLVAGTKVSERIITTIKNVLHSPMPILEIPIMESAQVALENVVSAVFDGPNEFGGGNSEIQHALCRIFEGLLHQFLSLKWTDPPLVEVHAHYLDALGPFLKYLPDAAGTVITKLFELLNSLPFAVKDPGTSKERHARLQVCTSFIRIAKAADKSLLPHMKGIAETMAYMRGQGCLLRAEHNVLAEAFLIMASAAGTQQQQEVLAWLLEPLRQQWEQIDWQTNYLSEPLGLVRLCSESSSMWSMYHTVTFFEKALKRSGSRKGSSNSLNNSASTATSLHPMAPHLSWMLPPLLRLLRSIHSLWSPAVFQGLPEAVKAAMTMNDVERRILLGEAISKTSKPSLALADGSLVDASTESYAKLNETDIRNWLKGTRDSGYNVLGLSISIGESFFKCLDSHSVALALVENVQAMEFRHIGQLVHSVVIPLVKFCPSDLWEIWLENLLRPLFTHCQHALTCSWSSLLREGRAKVPDSHGILADSDLKVEVMEEKLLRDLSREICALLAAIASPGLNSGLPSLEQSGHVTHVEKSALKDLNEFAPSSMVSFLLKQGIALPALGICVEAFMWTDSESVTKVSSFCGTVVLLSIVTDNVALQNFVCQDLFSAIIRGLALESNAVISADLVNLCREIFLYLCDRDPTPRKILSSLPRMTPNDLAAFEEALTRTASPKEQKQHMRSLLLLGTGGELKALAAQKTVNVITNVSAKPRGPVGSSESRSDEGDSIGLAGII